MPAILQWQPLLSVTKKGRGVPFIQLLSGEFGQDVDPVSFFAWRDSNPLSGHLPPLGCCRKGTVPRPPGIEKNSPSPTLLRGQKRGLEYLPLKECSRQLIPHGKRNEPLALSKEPGEGYGWRHTLFLSSGCFKQLPPSMLPFLAAILRLLAQGCGSH